MKKVILQFLFFLLVISAFAQKPSKKQMEKDRKGYAVAQKKLNEQLSKMGPGARRMYDSMTGSVGMGQKIKDAEPKINNNPATVKRGIVSNGIIPVKNTKGIAFIAATPSIADMGAFIGITSIKRSARKPLFYGSTIPV